MKLPEPYTFFVDRALGRRVVPGALREGGLAVEAGDDHFPQNAPDVVWLPEVGRKGWVLLTKDRAIKTNQLERDALLASGIAAFMLSSANLPGPAMAKAFLAAMRNMERALRRYHVPFIAYVTPSAAVTIMWADGDWLKPPRTLK